MKSMTGFGIAEGCTSSGIKLRIEIVSYNKKQLDVRVLMAKEFLAFEHLVRKIAISRINRGAVTVRVDINTSEAPQDQTIKINENLAVAYARHAKKLQKKLKLSGEIDFNTILTLPGIIESMTIDHLLDENFLAKVVNEALDSFIQMREKEGRSLRADIKKRLKKLISLADKIEIEAALIPQQQLQRLEDNLKNSGLAIDPNDERLLKELVIFSDRYDVSEEITRLRSHFEQCEGLLVKNEPVGRAFDFLIQEIQREINTLSTKAAHCAISPKAVEFKTELEKIREQIQNVE